MRVPVDFEFRSTEIPTPLSWRDVANSTPQPRRADLKREEPSPVAASSAKLFIIPGNFEGAQSRKISSMSSLYGGGGIYQ